MKIPHEVKWRAATLGFAVFWAWWATEVATSNTRFWLYVTLAYAVWAVELRTLYCKWMRRRWTVAVYCEGHLIACRECAWEWSAKQAARRLASEYRHLRIGRRADEVQIHVACGLLTGDLPII